MNQNHDTDCQKGAMKAVCANDERLAIGKLYHEANVNGESIRSIAIREGIHESTVMRRIGAYRASIGMEVPASYLNWNGNRRREKSGGQPLVLVRKGGAPVAGPSQDAPRAIPVEIGGARILADETTIGAVVSALSALWQQGRL